MSVNNADDCDPMEVCVPSKYLSSEDNEIVFRLVGQRNVALCTTIVHLFTNEDSLPAKWIRKHTGALCLIKDNAKWSYFCRIYCLAKHELLWEQEMNDSIEIARIRPNSLTFKNKASKRLMAILLVFFALGYRKLKILNFEA